MHLRTTLLAAGLAAALAACGDAGTNPLAPKGGPRRLLGSQPSVTVTCYSPDYFTCDATASGGSGSGYSFAWSYNVDEQYDSGGYSWGDVNCHGALGWQSVSVAVTDSYGQTGYGSASIYCWP
jgi:hypothetical protein